MPLQTLTSANLNDATQNAALLLIAHNGAFDKKLQKAINSVAENEFAVATLDFTDDPAAIESLDINDSAATLLVFEDGDEIGCIEITEGEQYGDAESLTLRCTKLISFVRSSCGHVQKMDCSTAFRY